MAETTPATQTPTQEPTTATPNYDEIFSKLDAILDKRADGLAKSALKDNGVEEAEIADIVKAYREQKQTKATEQANALTQAQQTIADLQKQIADKAIDEAMAAAALELGVDAKQLPYVTRLAARDGVCDDAGAPNVDKVKEAINKVLEDVPALKATANANKGFQPVGAKAGDGADSGDDADKKLRGYFGLK
jgi:DNA-binding transcriptional MerR regulator